MAPLIDSITWDRRSHFRWWDLSKPWIQFFPVSLGDLELFTAEEVAKLKELGVLNPPNVPGHLPLFPPLVSSSRGKVVSATLGVPPPGLDTHGIGQSLAADQEEESILSDSHSDCLSNTLDSSIMWGKHTMCTAWIKNRNHAQPSAETMDTSLVTRTTIKIVTGNVRNPKRTVTMTWFRLALRACSPWHKDHDGAYECGANGKHERSHGHDSPSDSRKTKQRWEASASLSHDRRKSHTPEC